MLCRTPLDNGYAFVGKGTLPGHLRRLQHKGLVYARLERLQGEVVPVHLGLTYLDGVYVPGVLHGRTGVLAR